MKCFLSIYTVDCKIYFFFSHVHNMNFCVGTMLVLLQEQNVGNYHFAEVQKQNVKKCQRKVLFRDVHWLNRPFASHCRSRLTFHVNNSNPLLSSNFIRNRKVVHKLTSTFAGLCLKKWVFLPFLNL